MTHSNLYGACCGDLFPVPSRRAAIVRSRDSRQRSLIAERAMANREMRKHKLTRDRAFAELVYGRIYMRTGGIVRAWSSIIANINRIRFMVSSGLCSCLSFSPWTRLTFPDGLTRW